MAQQDSGTTGIGDDDINEHGQADATTDQSETGGSGGAGLTRNEGNGVPGGAGKTAPHPPTESGARGAEDTRADQAGADAATGLGSAETGANQTPDDLAPASPASPGA
ncbi:MAG: hypothetical protein M3Y65_22870 [Pseudomonadota bacterium]|nr:hypothetical protein [Pseudomonadota bacterium]